MTLKLGDTNEKVKLLEKAQGKQPEGSETLPLICYLPIKLNFYRHLIPIFTLHRKITFNHHLKSTIFNPNQDYYGEPPVDKEEESGIRRKKTWMTYPHKET